MLAFIMVLWMIGSASTLKAANAAKASLVHSPSRKPPSVQAGSAARWTVLVYIASDNDLEAAALNDMLEIASVGSSAQLSVVVQLDRISSLAAWDSTDAGNWDGTKRLLVRPGMTPDAWTSAEDLGELNTGDPANLADFITWGVTSYPADHYALIIWSHGAAWQGLAIDDTSGRDGLTLPELRTALISARERAGYATLDLIGFDACLMSQLDVLETIAPFAQVAVASAELEPTQGWAWDVWLDALAANPEQDAYAIAPVIVDSYISSYQGTGTGDATLAAFDLTQVDKIAEHLGRLADALLAEPQASHAALSQARARADTYAPDSDEEYSAVDLGQLAQLLPAQGATYKVAAAAEALASAVRQARLANGLGPDHRDASGVSVYFPATAELHLANYERESPLPQLTHWGQLLEAFHQVDTTGVAQIGH
ncbi:MAG: hypothetical protein HGA45_22455 [Chloroflexales bacterium]|nr:hypothetical protein [Chloroflexales bacterium]